MGFVLRNSVPLGFALVLFTLPHPVAAAGVPASLTLTPGSAEIAAGDTKTFTAKLLDAAGQETVAEANSNVGYAVDVSSFASVTPNADDPMQADVLGKRPGMTKLRAFYVRDGAQTNVFAAADLTVVTADAGASETGGASGTGGAAGTGGTDAGPVACAGADLTKDPRNCGTCGHVCLSDQVCSNGGCATQTIPTTTCGNKNTSEDPENCGKCGHACASGELCNYGACRVGCSASLTKCGDVCSQLSDRKNCGACGLACGDGEECNTRKCVACAAGAAIQCGERCVDMKTDEGSCGGCGIVCQLHYACVDATCVADPTGDKKGSGGCSLSPNKPNSPPGRGLLLLVAIGGLVMTLKHRRRQQ